MNLSRPPRKIVPFQPDQNPIQGWRVGGGMDRMRQPGFFDLSRQIRGHNIYLLRLALARKSPSLGVFGVVDFAHAGQRERAGAGQFDAQFQLAPGGLDEPAQGGQVEVGLALDLEHRGLLDPQAPGDLLLTAFGELAHS